MMEFIVYDLKVAVFVAVFYMFYRLLLSRETFHRVNRVVLLMTAIASFVLPLCVITQHRTVVVEPTVGSVGFEGLTSIVEAETQTPFWHTLLIVIFFTGIAATLGYTIQSLLRVWMLIRRSEQYPQSDGTVICVTEADISPFSFYRYIIISHSDYTSPQEGEDGRGLASILAHERGHIRLRHSFDLLLVDTLTALLWFNPAMWMLRQDLRAIHEYEADAAVLSQGINMRQYQYLLIQKAVGHCGYSVANGISHSTLKNRIEMMLQKNSSRASLLKLLALLPVLGVALALQAETVNDYVYNIPQPQLQKKIVKKGRKNSTVNLNGQIVELKADTVNVQGQKKQIDLLPVISGSGTQPLIVIDGVRVDPDELKNLDALTIDHVNVLKNESAAEAYGADGKNGVLEIHTKFAASEKSVPVVSVDTPDNTEPLDVVDQMPEYPGGLSELMKFLSMNIRYPKTAQKAGVEGRVIAQFVVGKDGSVSNIKVVRHVNQELDAEAVRVISTMPNWKPGIKNGVPVRVRYTLPISFRLNKPAKSQEQPADSMAVKH